MTLQFIANTMRARIIAPGGAVVERPIEMRINPITGRTSRITFSRGLEAEPGAERLPVSGISEWHCWYTHFKTDLDAVDADRVVESPLAVGVAMLEARASK